MNAPTVQLAAQQLQEEKIRIHIAGQIAAGMASNPFVYEDRSFRTAIPFEAVNMADKIINLVRGGGI